MFTHLISEDDNLIEVGFTEYAKKHYLKYFLKNYKGTQWSLTLKSILEDIGRIKVKGYSIQETQQVDELWHNGNCWIFKYDFRIAGTKKSPKTAGNRCIVFMDAKQNFAEILLIYSKSNLPKNMGEQKWIEETLREEFAHYLERIK